MKIFHKNCFHQKDLSISIIPKISITFGKKIKLGVLSVFCKPKEIGVFTLKSISLLSPSENEK